MEVLNGFPPIVGPDPKVLILGSMPGAASLKKQQYYGYDRNHFWELMSKVLSSPCPDDYNARVDWLKAHHIALWDVIATCRRTGSLDKDIKSPRLNDIPAFIAAHGSLRAVCFNGATAMRLYKNAFGLNGNVAYMLLPSSSPVPRRKIKTMQDKLPAWLEIQKYI